MIAVYRVLIVFTCFFAAQVYAVQSVIWDKTPIRVNLVVGVEQMLHFTEDGRVGLSENLASTDVFRTLFTGKTAYWTAMQAFDRERIKVRLDSGEFIMFDVSATVVKSPTAKSVAINIVPQQVSNEVAEVDGKPQERPTIFDIIRYAAQNVYSPPRLIEPLLGIREVPLGVRRNLNAMYDAKNHLGLIFAPNKSWSASGIYVTAISIINTHDHAVVLDNRLVRHTKNANIHGVERHFIASMFYERTLQPKGNLGDKTTLFVVTDQPFSSAIRL